VSYVTVFKLATHPVNALEQPELFVNDLRSVFGRPLFRKSIDNSEL
jgi:hypothetical protein